MSVAEFLIGEPDFMSAWLEDEQYYHWNTSTTILNRLRQT